MARKLSLRRHPYTFDHFELDNFDGGNYGIAFVLGVVGTIIGALVLLIGFALYDEDTNNTIDRQEDLVTLFESVTAESGGTVRETRKQLAENLLMLYDEDSLAEGFIDDTEADILRDTAEDGRMPDVRQKPYDWGVFWHQHTIIFGALVFIYFSFITFVAYAWNTGDRKNYLLDLQWRRVWPVIFVLFTLPFGLPFYTVSAVRLIRLKDRTRPAHAPEVFYYDDDPYETPRPQTAKVREPVAHQPDAARTLYKELRTTALTTGLENRIVEAEDEVGAMKEELQELGVQLKEYQQRYGTAKADLRRLKQIETSGGVDPQITQLDTEFDKLLALPGVQSVGITDDVLHIEVHARYRYDGTLYDLGDWDMQVSSTGLKTFQLRSGVRADWPGGYPVYVYYMGDRFCHGGTRTSQIQRHIDLGQYLEAVELAINSMHSINTEHLYMVPDAYEEAEDSEQVPSNG